jgi:hypothetical protein
MLTLWNREPALIVSAFSAILALTIGFGVAVTPVQFGLIMAAVSALLGLVTRSQVTPSGGTP